MGLRGWIKRLERGARGDMPSFVLMDGSRHYYDPASGELFLHWCACLRAGNPDKWPEPPEVYKKLTEARDPEAAGEQLIGGGGEILPLRPGDSHYGAQARARFARGGARCTRSGGRGPQ